MSFTLVNSFGFFSNFIRVLSWLDVYENSKKKIPFYIDYKKENRSYCVNYKGGENIWEKIFEQPLINEKSIINNENITPNEKKIEYELLEGYIIDKYPYDLMDKYDFNNFGDMKNNYYYDDKFYNSENMYKYIEYYNYLYKKYIRTKIEQNKIKYENTLGIFIRAPVLYRYNDEYEYYRNILNEIEEYINDYDYIYVSTQVKPIYKLISEIYGDKLIKNEDISRIDNINLDWIFENKNLENIYMESFKEASILGSCKFILGSNSNYFLGSLIINNNKNFKLFNFLKNYIGK